MEPYRKKCLPMYPAAINKCAKLPTLLADSVETMGSIPHVPSGNPDLPDPEPHPKPEPKHKSNSHQSGKERANAIVAAIGGGTASGAAAHTGQQALRKVPTSRIARNPAFTGEEPSVSNPAIADATEGDVEMTPRPSISGEGLRNRGGMPRGTITAEGAEAAEATEGAEGAVESAGGLWESVGGGAAAAEEFGGAELAPETLGLSVAVAAIGGGIVGGASYLFGHHHHH